MDVVLFDYMKYGITCGECQKRETIDTGKESIMYWIANSGWKEVWHNGYCKHICEECYKK
jgi:hypothetical protein